MEQSIFRNALNEEQRLPEAVLVSVFKKGEDPAPYEASLSELERLLDEVYREEYRTLSVILPRSAEAEKVSLEQNEKGSLHRAD